MADYDILIKGGTIVDGTRTPRYKGDLAIKDGRIARIGGVRSSTADKVLDASGLYVVPGFVDLHTHYDAQIQWDPYCTLSGWHGVTSVVIGNCGFGFAPCHEEDRDRSMLTLTRNEAIPYAAMQHGMLWEGGVAHTILTAQVGCPSPRLSLIQHGYDLLLCVPLANHESSFNALS